MSADFLHGVETVVVNNGPVPVQVIKSSVIGLVGIAPKGDRNTVVLVTSDTDAAQFGKELPGFTIPQALNAIFAQGAATVLVVNVLDDATHLTPVTAEAHTIASGATQTTFAPVKDIVVTNATGDVTYVVDTDYSIDAFGNLTVLDFGSIAEGASIKISYKKLNLGAVANDDIIGEYDDTDDTYTGMQAWDLAFGLYGFNPKILIAPGFSTVSAVVAELGVKGAKFRAHYLFDAPAGTTISEAITGRGVSGSINFNVSDKWGVPCFPMLKAYDAYTNADENRPYSQFLAGVMASVDANEGYWNSPSNHVIKGVTGVEVPITWALNDPNCKANALNAVGIVTIAQGFGTGIRTWGNRSSLFPSSTALANFISIQRTAAIIDESVELACLQFIDKPINTGLIDSILATVNGFMRSLIGRGALIDGACTFDWAKNSEVDIAAGKLTFDNTFLPPIPGERFTFNSFIDISLIKSLAQQAA